jgi:hypothetical protein
MPSILPALAHRRADTNIGALQGGRTTSFTLRWDAATDNVSPSSTIVYLVYQANAPGSEDFSTPTYTTAAGATSFAKQYSNGRIYETSYVTSVELSAGSEFDLHGRHWLVVGLAKQQTRGGDPVPLPRTLCVSTGARSSPTP